MTSDRARKRVASLKRRIAQRIGISQSELRKTFPIQGQSTLWEKLNKLTSNYIDSHGWEVILDALKTAQQTRQNGFITGCSHSKPWQPIDIQNAAKSLSNIASSAPDPQTSFEAPRTLASHTQADTAGMNDSDSLYSFPSIPSSPSRESLVAPPEDGSQGVPGVHVVFCDMTQFEDIAKDRGFRSLTVNPRDPFFRGSVMNSLTQQTLSELQRKAGRGLCSNLSEPMVVDESRAGIWPENSPNSATVHVHAIVLTLLWAKHQGSISVEFHDRDWLEDMLRKHSLEDYLEAFGKQVLLFTPMRRLHMTESQLGSDFNPAALDAAIEHANARSEHEIKSYPSRSEAQADRTRTSDMRLLEEVAKHAPEKFSFRPRLCYGKAGECQMKGFEGQVIERCDSTTSPGMTVIYESDDVRLNGTLECNSGYFRRTDKFSTRRITGSYRKDRYFHQELIPTLLNWGEIHVIMVGSEYFCACIRHGKYGDKDSFVSAVIADRCFKEWKRFDENVENVTTAEAEAKVKELEEFCRWWRDELIKRKPEVFETFKVAVRFDIGISKIGADAQFFINEMPRWPGADFMSFFMDFSYPYDEICQAIGQKFAAEYESIVAGESEEMKDETMSDSDLYGDD
ncbi:hypothetical protein FSARC_2841 [Fusarium sarcochroum]|uniref:Uncharacterized protein n=1 Tax=Fusarium sarcochroum TaxID=1208366 RepID=A0A8H4XDD0_9HYPO|nr:hypothetical protein FSARC_2841 [Fusarium sarcochroum]